MTGHDEEEIEAALHVAGVELSPGAFLSRARRVLHGDVTTTTAYKQGRVRIQDEGSQLVAELAGKGDQILDCCAAPGGKTAILAERNPSALVLACDVSARRLEQMKRLLPSLGGLHADCRISYEVADATEFRRDAAFDLVLCDVPCSGTGTLARNPEIRHRMGVDSLVRHQQRQIDILRSAMRTVAPGGRLIYSTCSLEPEENEDVLNACLDESIDCRQVAFDLEPLLKNGAIIPSSAQELSESAFDRGYLQTMPGVHPCDGFFAALIVRN